MTTDIQSASITVPGASLHYERRGTGPVLILIPGGPQDAGVFSGLAAALADRFTVIAIDPRGNSRSAFTGAAEPLSVDRAADDVAALIEALGEGPVRVFGTSGGAQIGLNLAARHPGLVSVLAAHEPPALNLLPDAEEALAVDREIREIHLTQGTDAALQKFFEIAGMDGDGEEAGPPPGEMSEEDMASFARTEANMPYFFEHGMMPLSEYVPDIAALRSGAARVVVLVGEMSEGDIAHRSGVALAEALGQDTVSVPGDHVGFTFMADDFADKLAGVL